MTEIATATAAPVVPAPDAATPADSAVDWSARLARRARVRADGDAIAAIMAQTEATDVITFSGGFPDPSTFPAALIGELTARLVAEDAAVAMQYAPTRGLAGVRDAVAGWLAAREERTAGENELMITSGGIDALGLIARSFLDPGDVVLVEDPSYLGAIMAFQGCEAQVRTVPLDGDGLDVQALADLLAGGLRPKLLYTIPDFQNPAGVTLAAERRPALVELCRRYGILLIEDAAYRELAFSGERLPSLWAQGPDVTVQIGTFSKTFFPGVRLGWAIGPEPVIATMVNAKQISDQCSGALGQRLVEEYIRGGHLDRQLALSRSLYASRCTALLSALDATMPAGVTWTRPAGGFFSWLTAPDHVDTTALAARAAAAGVTYVPGALFHPDGGCRHQLRLSFSLAGEDAIATGVERLAALLRR